MFMLRPMMLGAGLLSALRPQDVFATNLRTSNGGPQALTPGIDMAGAGGLAWAKRRSTDSLHILSDTVRGVDNFLRTHATTAEASGSGFSAPTSTGISFSDTSGQSNVIWSFRRASKFFDIVTYTGDGTSGRVIPHALGIKPGMIIVKRRDAVSNWPVYHSSLNAQNYLFLESTQAVNATAGLWNNTEPTSTGFTVGAVGSVNASGATYVAYLFAHDPDTTNGIVQCGSVSGGQTTITLGWRPQFLLLKRTDAADIWTMWDTARGWVDGTDVYLSPNSSNAEANGEVGTPTATGFTFAATTGSWVYMAIRAPI